MFNDGGLQQAASRSLATALWRAARTRLASPSAHRAACQVRARDQEARIAEREDKLARADVIDDPFRRHGQIWVMVSLIEENTGENKVWQIGGETGGGRTQGKISATAPIARALIGKTKGDG